MDGQGAIIAMMNAGPLQFADDSLAAPSPPLRLYPHKAVASRATRLAVPLAAADPELHLEIFEPHWRAVDRGRAELDRAGLADRVQVHHRDAFLCASTRAAFSDSRRS
jgi:hypothetical protein